MRVGEVRGFQPARARGFCGVAAGCHHRRACAELRAGFDGGEESVLISAWSFGELRLFQDIVPMPSVSHAAGSGPSHTLRRRQVGWLAGIWPAGIVMVVNQGCRGVTMRKKRLVPLIELVNGSSRLVGRASVIHGAGLARSGTEPLAAVRRAGLGVVAARRDVEICAVEGLRQSDGKPQYPCGGACVPSV